MMNERVALFLHFALMRNDLVLKAYQELQFVELDWEKSRRAAIWKIEKCVERILKSATKGAALQSMETRYLHGSEKMDFSPWISFFAKSSVEERHALIWLDIVKVPVEELALALGVSEGAVLHRANRALLVLSEEVA